MNLNRSILVSPRNVRATHRWLMAGVEYGGDNLLAVRCDNKTDIVGNLARPTGCKVFGYYCVAVGVYRQVWLFKTDPCHISPLDHGASGLSVTESNLTDGGADVSVKTELRNMETTERDFLVRHTVRDAAGKLVGSLEGRIHVRAGTSTNLSVRGRLPSVSYWSPETPRLYTVRTEVLVDGAVRDVVQTRTGFRPMAQRHDVSGGLRTVTQGLSTRPANDLARHHRAGGLSRVCQRGGSSQINPAA